MEWKRHGVVSRPLSANQLRIVTADLKLLASHRRRDSVFGNIKWACQSRNEQPQAPWVQNFKDNGAWDERLDRLPRNRVEQYLEQQGALP